MFSFDLEFLKFHLKQLFDVVDYFVIVESVFAHRDQTKKMWKVIEDQPRIKKLESRKVHFILVVKFPKTEILDAKD